MRRTMPKTGRADIPHGRLMLPVPAGGATRSADGWAPDVTAS